MTQFYVYLHCKPGGDPFYVGKGCDTWAKRSHDLVRARSRYHNNVVAKYGAENIEILVFNSNSEKEAFETEIKWIKVLRDAGYKLVNLTNGGEGPSGCVVSSATRAKHSARQKETWTGRKHTAETKCKMSARLKGNKLAVGVQYWLGKKMSIETKEKLSIIAKNRVFTLETRAKMSEAQKRRYAKT
jgi:hypothetical protein